MVRCSGNNLDAKQISVHDFRRVWKVLEGESKARRAFWLLSSSPDKKCITTNDFKLLFK